MTRARLETRFAERAAAVASLLSRSPADRAAKAAIGLFAVMAFWNASVHIPVTGYDAESDIDYATGLIQHGRLPHGVGSYYTPPGYYALAGAADWVGEKVGMGIPTQAGQYVNALLAVGTALLVLGLARTLWPGRTRLHAAALWFLVLIPVVVKISAMFHPEPLSLFLSTLSLFLGVRMLRDHDYRFRSAAALGLALGAAQLSRAWSLTTVCVVLVGLATAAAADRDRRTLVLRASAVTILAAILVSAPWYVHQARLYSNPVFDRPQVSQPFWNRRPAAFYLDQGFPQVVTKPYRDSYKSSFLPILYTETWGDYFGVWKWGFAVGSISKARPWLVAQSVAGALPTLLSCAGVVALLILAMKQRRRRPELVPVALLPLAALGALLYFAISYPTPDGDTVKGTYGLTAAPGFALGFGLVVDQLLRRRKLVVPIAILLGASGLVCLHFDVL